LHLCWAHFASILRAPRCNSFGSSDLHFTDEGRTENGSHRNRDSGARWCRKRKFP
jgi:hypothetical protein